MIWKTLLVVLITLSCVGLTWAAANSPIMQQRDSANSSTINRVMSTIGQDGIFYFDHTTKLPKLVPVTTLSVPGATGATGPTGAAGTNGTNATTTANATQSVHGLMSSGDKIIVDSLGTASVLNAPASGDATSGQAVKGSDTRLADSRAPLAHNQAISTITGLQSALDGKEAAGAAAAAQAYAIQRGNHTGTQPINTITSNGYSGTTAKNGVFPVVKTANVASGSAVFHLTNDGLSTGSALCGEVLTDSVVLSVNDATASYQIGWTFSNLNKTLTAVINKLTTANILTGLLGQASAPNGTPAKLSVLCAS